MSVEGIKRRKPIVGDADNWRELPVPHYADWTTPWTVSPHRRLTRSLSQLAPEARNNKRTPITWDEADANGQDV